MQPSTWIVAQQSPWKYMGKNFKGEEAKLQLTDVIAVAVILGAVVLGAWALTRFLARQERRRRFNNPAALFDALCRVHGLDIAERKLLLNHARGQGLEDPGRVFLEPERFGAKSITPAADDEQQQLASIKVRLFGDYPGGTPQGVAPAGAGAAASAGALGSAGAGAAAGGVASFGADLPAS
jgi:hypothetical protein